MVYCRRVLPACDVQRRLSGLGPYCAVEWGREARSGGCRGESPTRRAHSSRCYKATMFRPGIIWKWRALAVATSYPSSSAVTPIAKSSNAREMPFAACLGMRVPVRVCGKQYAHAFRPRPQCSYRGLFPRWRIPRLAVTNDLLYLGREFRIEDCAPTGLFFVLFCERDALGDGST